MKIMFVGHIRYPGFLKYITNVGHEYIEVRYWDAMTRFNISVDDVNDMVLRRGLEYDPDVIVVFKGWIDGNRYIRPETIKSIKDKCKCPAVFWSVDDPDFLGFFNRFMNGHDVWDVALTCCKASMDSYRMYGIDDARYFLPGHDTLWPVDDVNAWANPTEYGSPVVEKDVVDLTIVGHPYWSTGGADLGRAALAVAALEAGMTVEIYGPAKDIWTRDTREECKRNTGSDIPFLCGHPALEKCYKGWLKYDEVWRAWIRAKVSFNNHLRKGGGYYDKYYGYCNDKVFQITGSGGCMLMDHQAGISPDIFEAGVEYVEYEPSLDPNVCLESAMKHLKEMVSNDDMREAIRRNARKRCLEEHTWERRADQLFDILRDHGVK